MNRFCEQNTGFVLAVYTVASGLQRVSKANVCVCVCVGGVGLIWCREARFFLSSPKRPDRAVVHTQTIIQFEQR